MAASLYLTARIRKSPFFDETVAAGATQFSVYNKTYLPGGFRTAEAEFWSLVNDVVLWDVTCQRVVEVTGPDAHAFANYLTPRNLLRFQPGQCRYLLLTEPGGGILNDPVVMCLSPDRIWFSSADSDVAMWMRGVLTAASFDVAVRQPEVATLQLQGPSSLPLLCELVGDSLADLGYYRHARYEIDGIPVLIARTGWSAERGYELYLLDLALGPRLWRTLMSAGARFRIAAGSPSRIRRIEAGILDYSVDMDVTTNPFEVGLERLVSFEGGAFLGREALQKIAAEPVARTLTGLEVAGAPVTPNERPIPLVDPGETEVGQVTSWVYSPRLERNIALAMLACPLTEPGTTLTVTDTHGPRTALVVPIPFYDPERKRARG